MKEKFLIFVLIFNFTFIFGINSEEKNGYRFKRWFEEVSPIMTEAERDVFEKLNTIKEKEKFIEEFWKRRDPTPDTLENEFREEYEKRLAYVNENFSCVLPGYLTDRGKVYLLLGKPHLIFSYPLGISGNSPFRHLEIPAFIPVEIWQYRFIQDYGVGVNFLFVSKNNNCNYTLINSPGELDALLGTYNQQKEREEGEEWDFKDEFASYFDVRNVVLYGFSHKKSRFNKYVELKGKDFYVFDFNLINSEGKNILYIFLEKILKENFESYFVEVENIRGDIVDEFEIKLKKNKTFFPIFLKRGVYLLRVYCVKGNEIFRFTKRIEIGRNKNIGKILFLRGVSKKIWSPFSIFQDKLFLTPLFSIANLEPQITFYYQANSELNSPIYEIYNLRGKLLFLFKDKDNKTLLNRNHFYTSYLAQLDVKGLKKGFYKVVVKFKRGEKVYLSSNMFFLK